MRLPAHFDNARNDGLIICEREDFYDYLWMADEESFDKQVLAELQEEEEMEQCMEEMLAEEEARDTTYYVVDNGMIPTGVIQTSMITPGSSTLPLSPNAALWAQHENDNLNETVALQALDMVPAVSMNSTEILSVSQLNPEASEFVPSRSAHPVPSTAEVIPSSPVDVLAPSSHDLKSSKSGTSEAPDR